MTSPVSDDLLARAARALRDEADRDPPDAVDVEVWQAMHGWRDVSRNVRQAARRRRVGLIVGLQLVTALAGVGAWAAVSGRLPALFSRPAPAARPAPPAPAKRAHATRARPPAASPPAPPAEAPPPPPEAPAETPAPAPAPPAPPKSVPAPRALAPARQPHRPAPPPPAPAPLGAAKPAVPARAPEPAPAPEDLYRQAHEAHFVRRDHAAALVLWETYLATGGSLALEARYNRAIALVRLGRREAAIAALTPFAGGEHDGYRQEEAQALLRLLGAAPP